MEPIQLLALAKPYALKIVARVEKNVAEARVMLRTSQDKRKIAAVAESRHITPITSAQMVMFRKRLLNGAPVPRVLAPTRKPAVAVLVRTMPKAVISRLRQKMQIAAVAAPRPEPVQ